MAMMATTMRPTTQSASMMRAAGNTGPFIALFELIKVMLQRPKVTTIVTAKVMASFARVLRLRFGGRNWGGVAGVLIEGPQCFFSA